MKKYAVLLALAVSLLLVQTAAALVVNGGFEDGNFTGWAYSGDMYAGVDGDTPHSGTYYGFFGNIGSLGVLSQTIPTTPGAAYNVSFWLWSGGFTNQLQAKWDGLVKVDESNIPMGSYTLDPDHPSQYLSVAYTQYQFTAVAGAGSSTLLEFGLRNDNSYLYMDDISVTQITIPIPGAVWLLLD